MAVKEEEDSSGSDENIGKSEPEDDSEAEESEQEDSAEDEEEEEEEEETAVTVKKNVDAVVKSDVNKLDKAGLNEFLVKLRRPITQAKVIHILAILHSIFNLFSSSYLPTCAIPLLLS